MDTPAVVVTLRIVVPQEGLRRALAALVGPVAAQPGCQRCELAVGVVRADVVTLVEEWATRADLDAHLRSESFRQLLATVEASSEPPEFRIDTIARREGLEAVARCRSATT